MEGIFQSKVQQKLEQLELLPLEYAIYLRMFDHLMGYYLLTYSD